MNSNLFLHIRFWEYSFYQPWWLLLLALVPIFTYWRYRQFKRDKGSVKFSRFEKDLEAISFKPIKIIMTLIYTFVALGFSLLVLAMAKPYLTLGEAEENYEEGIDIIISMDVSGSMLAMDFLPNRLEAAKQMAKEFIDGRKSDRIGFVAFEGEAYTVCPTTRNYEYLKRTIDETQTGVLVPGTAIGVGLGTAVARLRSDSLVSKVIILLTDGENNRGNISPMAAAELAKNKNITVYTIGVGKKGMVEMPINTPFGQIIRETEVSIDDDLLTEMAELTGGKYFRATDENSLREIYKIIDRMETQKFADKPIHREPPVHPQSFLLFGIIFLIIGFVAEQFLLRNNG